MKRNISSRGFFKMLAVSVLIAFAGQFCLANPSTETPSEPSEAQKMNAGEILFEHLLDSYEWHIFTWKGKHVSVPLRIIVYDNGLYSFSTKRLHHGNTYTVIDKKTSESKTFAIAGDGKYKGKVVVVNPDGTQTRPLDISITKNVFGVFISSITVLLIFFFVVRGYKKRGSGTPKGIQSLIEPVYVFIRDDIAKKAIGKKYDRYLPYLVTVFFFILVSNLFGLIPFFPFGANLTGNIAVTATLALFTFFITNLFGTKHYYKDIFNTPGVPWWLKVPLPLMPLIETVGLFTKPFVLALRLFANITAGHIVVMGFITAIFVLGEFSAAAGGAMSVMSLLLAVFVDCLELLVAFIQAYVFTLLSAVYFGMASK